MSATINAWALILVVMGILGGVQSGVTGLGAKYRADPETMRKLVHVLMGLVCAAFPWMFDAVWPVVTLGFTASAWLFATKTVPSLRAKLGQAVNSIERQSYGDVAFCAGVAALWWLSFGNALLYVVPVLVLTFADAGAALVGIKHGRNRYRVAQGSKSLEGSATFLIVAFLCVALPIRLFTAIGTVETVLISTIIGLLITQLEAIAWRGMDNIFIPLGTYILLKAYLQASVEVLISDLIAVALIAGFVIAWRKRTTEDPAGVLTVALISFLVWSLGGWLWLVPGMIVFVSYNWIYGRRDQKIWQGAPIYGVLATTSAPLAWLFLAANWQRADFYLPYTFAFAAHLACIGVARMILDKPPNIIFEFVKRVVEAWILLFVPYLITQNFSASGWIDAGIGLCGIFVATIIFFPTMSKDIEHYHSGRRWITQAIIVGGLSLPGGLI